MRIPVIVGRWTFATPQAATGFFQEILYRHRVGSRIARRLDHEFLLALLARHPESADKIGPGVRAFRVALDDCGTRRFAVERVDGASADFSFRSWRVAEVQRLQAEVQRLQAEVERLQADRDEALVRGSEARMCWHTVRTLEETR